MTRPSSTAHTSQVPTHALGASEREMRNLYEAIVESSDDGIISKNLEGRILSWNAGAQRIFGYTPAEMLGQPITLLFPPDRLNEENEIIACLKQGKRVDPFETVRRTKDGRLIDVSVTISPFHDQGGSIVGASKIVRDITQQKTAFENLRQNREHLQAIVNSVKEGVFTLDTECRVLDMNPAAEHLTDWKKSEAMGKEVSEVVPLTLGPVANSVSELIRRAQHEGGETHLSDFVMMQNRSGVTVPISVTTTSMSDKSGGTAGSLVVIRDATTDFRRRVALEAAREHLNVIYDSAPFALIAVNCSGTVTAWSKGAERLYGWTAREAVGKVAPMIDPADLPEFLQSVRRATQGRIPIQMRARRKKKDGALFTAGVTLSSCHDPLQEMEGALAIEEDVTIKDKTEQLQRRSQRLESIGTLAGGIAHDLNNALGPILMTLDLIKLKYPAESELVGILELSAKHGAEMVKQLLSYAKGAEGERTAIDPTYLLKDLETLVKGTFPKNIVARINWDQSLPSIIGDSTQIRQVLVNLCVNARDAMPAGGFLEVDAAIREIDETFAVVSSSATPGTYVAFSVRDTGSGISKEILERIFDPFFSTKSPDKGSGLGLANVLGILKGHCGFIQVESQPGAGSTFTAYFPCIGEVTAAQEQEPAIPRLNGQRQCVLLVDDEDGVREIGAIILRKNEFEVLSASDGAEALHRFLGRKEDVSFIISDLHMPYMDGIAFVSALRKLAPSLPVLMISGNFSESELARLRDLSVFDFLTKPFSETQLVEALAKILGVKTS